MNDSEPRMYLSDADLKLLAAAQQALLAPLEHADLAGWQQQVNRLVRACVGADHTLFFFPEADELALFSDDTDEIVVQAFLDLFERWEPGLLGVRDRNVNAAHRVRQQQGSGVYHERMLGSRRTLERTALYGEALEPAGVRHMIGMSLSLDQGEASLCIGFEEAGARDFGEQGLQKLALLMPSFAAGVQTRLRLAAQREILASVFDVLQEALCAYTLEMHELYRNRALHHLLQADPESRHLEDALQAFAAQLCRHCPASLASPIRHVRTTAGRYLLSGSPLPAALFGMEGVLITIEQDQLLLPTPERLRQRFGLTSREAEVAYLLAEGCTSAEIAAALGISRSTARRHTEQVLYKLHLSSRAAVALKLLREG